MTFYFVRKIGPAYVWRDSKGHEWVTLFHIMDPVEPSAPAKPSTKVKP